MIAIFQPAVVRRPSCLAPGVQIQMQMLTRMSLAEMPFLDNPGAANRVSIAVIVMEDGAQKSKLLPELAIVIWNLAAAPLITSQNMQNGAVSKEV